MLPSPSAAAPRRPRSTREQTDSAPACTDHIQLAPADTTLRTYQLSPTNPRDGIALRDKLPVDRGMYRQLSWPTSVQFITLQASTFVQLS